MPIRIGTAERGGTFHLQGLALKRVLEREPILAPVEIVEMHEASIENARRLEAGDITFGFMAANWVTAAQQGTPPFNAALGVRLAAPMNAGPLFFISLASSPLTRGTRATTPSTPARKLASSVTSVISKRRSC